MDFTPGQIIVWLVIGLLAGTLAGMLVQRRKKGFGKLTNLLIGLMGALIGGFLFDVLNIQIGETLQFSMSDLIAAFVGSLIFLLILSFIRR